ncbi:MAG: UbiA prenyltransferase family protein [Phycisphaerae bacterium]
MDSRKIARRGDGETMSAKDLAKLIRPDHWVKNVIVLFPVVTAMKHDEPAAWALALLTAGAFCFASSGIYVLNDIFDRRADLAHPSKKDRPIASGRVAVRVGWLLIIGCLLLAGAVALATDFLIAPALGVGQWVRPVAFAGILVYVALQVVYTLRLKWLMLLDVICIALGFVIRAAAGAVVIRVAVSPWLFVLTFTLCMFMGFCKRRNENVSLADPTTAQRHRATLAAYTPELLGHLISVSAGIAIVSYLLYTVSPRTIDAFGTHWLVYTLPLVVYAIFRFAMLSMRGNYKDPTDLIFRDRPFQLAVLLWALLAVLVIIEGRDAAIWFRGNL